jgi:hypothetical protein
MSKYIQPITYSMLILAFLMTSGCSAPRPAGLTDAQITSVTENILNAVDANDYLKFTRDFSNTMQSTFTQKQFDDLRTLLQKASGSTISLGTRSLSNNQGYAVYRFPAQYTNETVYVTLTFLVGGSKVEGLWFDSVNLRKTSP